MIGEVFEVSPVMVFPYSKWRSLAALGLDSYVYDFGKNRVALAHGVGSFFNHSLAPNAVYEMDFRARERSYRALVTIGRGEEIFVNYNGDPSDTSPWRFGPK